MQVHEWGGTFKNLVMNAHFRRFRPGLRVAVNLFGGHYWRTQVRSPLAIAAMSISSELAYRTSCIGIFCHGNGLLQWLLRAIMLSITSCVAGPHQS